MAVPRFADLTTWRPKHVGVVYRCDSCNAPIFLRFAAKIYGAQRIELSAQFTEVERPREKFSYSYLPETIETLFRFGSTRLTSARSTQDSDSSALRRSSSGTRTTLLPMSPENFSTMASRETYLFPRVSICSARSILTPGENRK